MKFLIRPILSAMLCSAALATSTALVTAQSSDDKAIVVFDASGSMWGQINGKSKIEIAREKIGEVLGGLPDNLQLGMMAYGHNRKGDCSDIQTMVDVGPVRTTGPRIAQSIRKISPKGKTPLSEAVKQAAEKLRYTEDKATVILITDGIETCNADPCALGNLLEQNGIDFTAHVVGFGLSDEEGRQVSCLAQNTGGLYLQANNADGLAEALEKTVAVIPPAPDVEPQERPKFNFLGKLALIEGGEPLPLEATEGRVAWTARPIDAQGNLGQKVGVGRNHEAQWSAAPGKYLLAIEYPGKGRFEREIELSEFDVLDEVFVLNAARFSGVGTFMKEEYNQVDWAGLEWRFVQTNTKHRFSTFGYNLGIIVPPGEYEVSFGLRGEKPSVNKPRIVSVAAGDTKQLDFIVPSSLITVKAMEANGTQNTSIRQLMSLRNDDGTSGEIVIFNASPNPTYVRPGKYVLKVELWDGSRRKPVEVPIDVGIAENQTITVPLQ